MAACAANAPARKRNAYKPKRQEVLLDVCRVRTGHILVVLAHKHDWQFPQLSNVVRLKDLALVGRPVTVQRNTDQPILEVLVRHRDPRAERNLRSHDAVASKQSWCVPGSCRATVHLTSWCQHCAGSRYKCATTQAGAR